MGVMIHSAYLLLLAGVSFYLSFQLFAKSGELEKEHINHYRKPTTSFVWVPVSIMGAFLFLASTGVMVLLFLRNIGWLSLSV